MKAGIIGLGVVGSAQSRLFGAFPQVAYDPRFHAKYPYQELAGCDFAVIAVPTPPRLDGGADLGYVHAAFADLPPELPVVIRSTVPPGTTGSLARDWGATVAFVPEFLYEGGTGPWAESGDVPWMVLGGDPGARAFFRPHLEKAFTGPIHECDAVTAELVKYTANLHWAMRVTFVNELAGICRVFGADWEDVRAAWL